MDIKINPNSEKELKLKRLKVESDVQRKINMANKRLKRLENNNMQNLPAYRQFVDSSGKTRFSVKGKDYNEVQSELAKVEKFLNNKTSLVRQGNQYLKDIADKVGMEYTKVGDLNKLLSGFFEVASKVEQYLRTTQDSASSIGYQAIWRTINEYIEKEKEDLKGSIGDYNKALESVVEMLALQETEKTVLNLDMFKKL